MQVVLSLNFYNKLNFDPKLYKEYESYAKDYYSRVSSVIKGNNLTINFSLFEGGERISLGYINFWITNNDKQLFKAKYFWNIKNNKVEYNFYGFKYIENNNPKYISLQDLIQTSQYKNFKFN